jgi:hypothetical protein
LKGDKLGGSIQKPGKVSDKYRTSRGFSRTDAAGGKSKLLPGVNLILAKLLLDRNLAKRTNATQARQAIF